jgi:hypothetical protein
MNTFTQFAAIADDDLLWVRYGVDWFGGAGSIAGLLESPTGFIADHSIEVIDNGVPTPAVVNSPFIVSIKGPDKTVSTDLGVQGIHDTSILTVRHKASPERPIENPVGIPMKTTIEVTLVPDVGMAYLHWQLSEEPTTAREVAAHVASSLLDPRLILADYLTRLNAETGNAQVKYVDIAGKPIDPQPTPKNMVVEYPDTRDLLCQGDENREYEIHCNVDIGNYYIDANGVIHIVTNTTIVKMY